MMMMKGVKQLLLTSSSFLVAALFDSPHKRPLVFPVSARNLGWKLSPSHPIPVLSFIFFDGEASFFGVCTFEGFCFAPQRTQINTTHTTHTIDIMESGTLLSIDTNPLTLYLLQHHQENDIRNANNDNNDKAAPCRSSLSPVSLIEYLPPECIFHIISFLTHKDVCRLAQVCITLQMQMSIHLWNECRNVQTGLTLYLSRKF